MPQPKLPLLLRVCDFIVNAVIIGLLLTYAAWMAHIAAGIAGKLSVTLHF